MKKQQQPRIPAKPLVLRRELVKVLSDSSLEGVHGGHTSFSCGRDLCTTHLQ